MKQKRNRIFCSIFCAFLLLGSAACSRQIAETPSSSQAQESVSSAPQETPTPAPTQEPDSTPSLSQAEDPNWSGSITSGEEGTTEYLPPIETEDEQFQKAFAGNAIDSQFELEYSTSTSLTLMSQACNHAAERWKLMIDIVYQEVLELAGEDDRNSIKSAQEEWAAGVGGRLQEIRDAAQEASGGALEAARSTMLLYRERAVQLCELQYSLNGTLPDFTAELPEEGAKG